MPTLVTGSKGFIASHFIEVHEDCIGYDIKDGGRIPPKGNIDNVIHLGALTSAPDSIDDPKTYWEHNVEATHVLREYYKDVPFFFASSAAVYKPLNPYALTKCVSEEFLKDWPYTTIARFFNVFGERDRKSAIYIFIRNALLGEDIPVFGDGNQTRDFIYVKDLVDNFAHNGLIYDIGYGDSWTINHIVQLILKYTGSKSKIKHLEKRYGDPQRTDSANARNITAPYGFYEGLRRTINWVDRTL